MNIKELHEVYFENKIASEVLDVVLSLADDVNYTKEDGAKELLNILDHHNLLNGRIIK